MKRFKIAAQTHLVWTTEVDATDEHDAKRKAIDVLMKDIIPEPLNDDVQVVTATNFDRVEEFYEEVSNIEPCWETAMDEAESERQLSSYDDQRAWAGEEYPS